MSTTPTAKVPRSNAVIGARRNPNVTPGGFAPSNMARDQTNRQRGREGCMEVANAATKWLDGRAVR